MLFRILASIVLLWSVLFMPFWLSVILALVGIIYFYYFIEAVAIGLLSDLLFGVPLVKPLNIVFISAVIAIILVLFAEFIKKKIR